jgi:DNA-directed RNA polymerase subunit RPC12/RpoP
MWKTVEIKHSLVWACPLCGKSMDEEMHCEDCGVVIDAEAECPECGSRIWRYNDPGVCYGQVTCINPGCDYTETDTLSWEDIKAVNNK